MVWLGVRPIFLAKGVAWAVLLLRVIMGGAFSPVAADGNGGI